MKNISVFTAITDGYDDQKPVLKLWAEEADFISFTPSDRGAGWQWRPLHAGFADPCRNAKIHKILSHRYLHDYQYSVWVDGCVLIKSCVPLTRVIAECLSAHDIAVFRHRTRRCIYEEAIACIKAQKDDPAVINEQITKYRTLGYAPNQGLAECTVIFRRHTRRVMTLNEAWYNEISRHSRRDQLSFNYVANKLGVAYHELQGTIAENPHFDWLPHAKPSRLAAAAP